jgi:hypothetical protein
MAKPQSRGILYKALGAALALSATQLGFAILTTFTERMAEFVVDRLPADETPVELLCLDHNGTYVLPFLCRNVSGDWINTRTGERIQAQVAGWRFRQR